MVAKVFSAAPLGVEAVPVEIEVDEGRGTFSVIVVGLPDTVVKESKDRVLTALRNSGFSPPRGRVTVNLAPADIKKEGPSFDLPIALGILVAGEQIDSATVRDFLFIGELALDGAVRPVRGALTIALEARRQGKCGVVVAPENAAEAALVEGLQVVPMLSLRDTVEWLCGRAQPAPVRLDPARVFDAHRPHDVDFADVSGQHGVKRALEIAAAGQHNVLMVGPPGSGKSMLAKRLATILPPLTLEEALETTKIHSIGGLLSPDRPFVATRPFRAPHHTISDVGLVGGGTNPGPGEISLAHNGVLFLDELPEFRRSVLEVLRQPLEDGTVTISRAAGSMTFPARMILVCAMNPTPDGKDLRISRSSPQEIRRYLSRISAPLLDRIDLHVEVRAVALDDLTHHKAGESSEAIRARVVAARELQRARYASLKRTRTNGALSSRDVRRFCALDESTVELLRSALAQSGMSARAYDRILKVARTIADLAQSDTLTEDHVLEALSYRTLDRQLWG